jgi:N,N'-diacetyllegionaminate synthase
VTSLYIVAECAQGYASDSFDSSLALAMLLTRSAKSAGADAVKFQLVIAAELSTPDYKYYNLFKSLELGYDGWSKVASLAKELSLDLSFDVFGETSLSIAVSLEANSVKIHPTDLTNSELIKLVDASPINNVILGCGGANHTEIETAVNQLANTEVLYLLHGFQGYPTLLADNCLGRLQYLASFVKASSVLVKLGFADHTDPLSSDATHLAATSLGYGVSLVEKHLTLARCLQLEDHESALSPDEFLSFVEVMRACYEAKSESLVISNSFELPDAENTYRISISRHVVAKTDLVSDHIIRSSDICLKRTSASEAICDPLLVVGKKTLKPIKANSPFTHGNVHI